MGNCGLTTPAKHAMVGGMNELLKHMGAGKVQQDDWAANLKAIGGRAADYFAGESGGLMGGVWDYWQNKLPDMMDAVYANEPYNALTAFETAGAGVVGGVPGMPKKVPGTVDVGLFGGTHAKGFGKVKSGDKFPGLADPAKRFEISDHRAKLSKPDLGQIRSLFSGGKVAQGDVVNGKLSQLFKHKKLYRQYPELAGLELQFKRGSGGVFGRTKEGTPIISVGVDQSSDEIINTLLHEINHNISEIEGWPIGGSPDEFGPSRDVLAKEWDKAQRKEPNKYQKVFDARQAARDRYLRQADEAQAEEVVARRKMTPRQRKKKPPFAGLDPNDYEVRYSDGL
jgi:hypothetical protein